jgi:predicted TIM-barrel fold metal-dependent hydrolase
MHDAFVIDADGHFNEPQELFASYLAPEFRWAAPKMVVDNQGRNRSMIGGEMMPFIPQPKRIIADGGLREGRTDMAARIRDMDDEGIDVMVIYPTKGVFFYGIKDVAANAALCDAYNRWASDQFSIDPERIIGPCVVPQIDPALAARMAAEALGKPGIKGVMLRPNPIGGRNLDHPAFEPLWNLMEETGSPLILHEGTTMDVPQFGEGRYDNFLYRHAVSHVFEQEAAIMTLIMGGVLERHPKLKVVVAECGVGWAPHWIDRLDDHHEHWGVASIALKEKPSFYFQRQCFIAAEGAEALIPFVVGAMGDDNICFSTDYPHPDHPFKGVVDSIRTMEGVSDESKRKILGLNAARLFNLSTVSRRVKEPAE